MIDYERIQRGASGKGSKRSKSKQPDAGPLEPAVEIARLKKVIELQKGELQRLRRLLGHDLLPNRH